MKSNLRISNLLTMGLLLTCFSASSAFAQSDVQTKGVTTVGAMAVERTVEDIMKNPEPISPDSFFQHLIKSTELEVDRHGLPMDPNSKPLAHGPLSKKQLQTDELMGKNHGGRYNPQTVGTVFQGDIYGNLTPSDAYGAVGPTQILVTTNHNVTVFSKAGVAGALNTTLDNFFTSVRAGIGTSDPRATFDRLTNKWYVIAINVSTPNRTMIAVSDGPTITGSTVWRYFFTTAPANTFDDYCSLGVDQDGVYVGYNVFVPSSYGGTQGIAIQKASIQGVGPIISTRFTFCSAATEGPSAPRGVDNDDPSNHTGYFIGPSNIAFGRFTVRKITWPTPTSTPTMGANQTITVNTTANPITPVSSNGSTTHDQIDDRAYDATMHLNRKTGARTCWVAQHSRGTNAGVGSGAGDRNIAKWYEFDLMAATPAVLQQGSAFASGTVDHFSFPSVAMTGQGHMAMAFSMIQPGSFVRTGAAGKLFSQGTTQATTVAYTATQTNTIFANRWGDYSMTKVDPANDQTCWAIQHQCAGASWKVMVIELKAPGPAPVSTVAPSALIQGNNYNITVTGTSPNGQEYFDTDAAYPNRLQAAFSGTGVTVNSISAFNHLTPLTFTMNVTVSGAAAIGSRNLTITNPDGQTTTFNNAVTVSSGTINQTVVPNGLTLFLGNITSGTFTDLASVDGVGMVICKLFVPSASSPFVRFSVTGQSTLSNLTAYAFSSTAKMNTGGTFLHTVEAYNFSTSTYDVTNSAAINTSYSTLTVTVPANFNNYMSGGTVQARVNVKVNGFTATATPCCTFDAASWALSGN